MPQSGRQCSCFRWLACLLLWNSACGTKPGGPQDEEHLLAGRWRFEALESELFRPERMLVAQSDEDVRVLLQGELFGLRFERFAVGPPAEEALVIQVSFARIEAAGQYEVLTLALDGRLRSLQTLNGVYEVRGNLASGGELRLESGGFSAVREPDLP
jgi:hypothetical protein